MVLLRPGVQLGSHTPAIAGLALCQERHRSAAVLLEPNVPGEAGTSKVTSGLLLAKHGWATLGTVVYGARRTGRQSSQLVVGQQTALRARNTASTATGWGASPAASRSQALLTRRRLVVVIAPPPRGVSALAAAERTNAAAVACLLSLPRAGRHRTCCFEPRSAA